MAELALERESYQYSSLEDQPDGFRLFNILPGDNDDTINCSIFTRALETKPSYTAISYTWGDQNLAEEITCDGRSLHITTNLAIALQQLKRNFNNKECFLYADGICIDQQNVKERGHQVGLMANIFRNADEVLIWLGLDSEGTAQRAFDLIVRYALFAREVHKTVRRLSRIPRLDSKSDFPAEPEDIEAVADILHRPWFNRVWVLQEVGLARNATLVCGSATLEFGYLVTFAHVVHCNATDLDVRLGTLPVHSADSNIWRTFKTRETWRKKMPLHLRRNHSFSYLTDVLIATCCLNTTDRRDYIYAMLGHPVLMNGETGDTLVQPDYTMEFEQLCYDLTVAAIEQCDQLSLLSLVQRSERDKSSAIPSWVPELGYGFRLTVIDCAGFCCCEGKKPEVNIKGKDLSSKGIVLDEIIYAAEKFPDIRLGATEETIASSIALITELLGMIKPEERYPGKTTSNILACILNGMILNIPRRYPDEEVRAAAVARYTMELEQFLQWFEDGRENHISNFYQLRILSSSRRVFKTKKGYWGFGPGWLQEGDRVGVLYGARVPYILRPKTSISTMLSSALKLNKPTERVYHFVGECYTLGLMDSEALDMLAKGEVREQIITIR